MPLAGAALLFVMGSDLAVRRIALAFTLADLALTIALLLSFETATPAMQFPEQAEWVPTLGISWSLGVDGISVLFVFLTALLGWICVLASWNAITTRVKEFMVALLTMQCLMLGVFCALDLFLFYVFWEAMLIPMYIIIGVWGGPKRVYATFKFFLYTLAGSLLFLVGCLVIYFQAGRTFFIPTLMDQTYPFQVQVWVFLAFLVAFAVKVPMVPFHTWLPDAHVEAPTAGSIVLAGVLLKMGAYGFLRLSLPILPDASVYFTPVMFTLSGIAIIYGGFLALAQDDMKKLIAYSSISHMGFVTLGIFTFNTNGVEGGVLQMFNHGVTTGALFLLIGLIYERSHTRLISDYGGLMKSVPLYSIVLGIFALSSMAMPGTNGFVSELLVISGAFGANILIGAVAVAGAMLSAAYLLSFFRRVALGPAQIAGQDQPYWDLNPREIAATVPLVVLVFWLGLYPGPFLNILGASVEHLLTQVSGTGG